MTDELDVALADLHPVPADDPEALRRVRARVLETVLRQPASRRSRLSRLPLAAAAAVLLVAMIAVMVRGSGPDGAMVLVAQTLNMAAAAPAGAADEPVPAGSYRYIARHSMAAIFRNDDLAVMHGVREELWVPADPAGDWFRLETDTGERVPLRGTADQIRAAKLAEPTPPLRETGRCGSFPASGLPDMCTSKGTWQVPTATFLAGLPRDPHRLFERLRDDTEGRGRDADQEVLVYAADALRTGLVPADLRSALYRALALLPALQITEQAATLDGRTGTALGITASGEQQEIVIDPATGAFIGERIRRTGDTRGLPAGTVTHWSSVVGGIAAKPWKPPARSPS